MVMTCLDAARKGTRAGSLVKNGTAMMAGRWRSGARGRDSERLSPGRDRRWHPRQVQRRCSRLRERKITLPSDLPSGALGMEGAAPFSGGESGARNPGRVERTGYDHAEGDKARTHDPRRRPRQRAADLHTRPFRSSSIMSKAKHSKPAPGDAAVRMTTAEATVEALIAHGIDAVYALPGVHNDPLFDALFKAGDRIRTVHTRHEQGAAYLALGAALATGKPQVYSVVPGPGLLNSAAALLTAYGMNAPVLAVIGQISQSAIGRGLGHLHEIRDQAGIIARLVDFSARIRAPTQAAALVARAVRAMATGRPGPAVLECAIDVWGRSAPAPAIGPVLPPPPQPIDEDVAIIRIDADPDEPERFARPAVAIIGDAAPILRRLIDALAAHHRPSRRADMEERQARMRRRLDKLAPQIGFLDAIRAALPEDGIFVDEVTQIGFSARLLLPVYKPRTFLSPGYQDNLGWGHATALGAQHARRDVPVLSITGDGGFLFTSNELATAMHHRIPLTVIVFNDGAFGNVRRIQEEQYGNRLIASDLANPDFVRYAQ